MGSGVSIFSVAGFPETIRRTLVERNIRSDETVREGGGSSLSIESLLGGKHTRDVLSVTVKQSSRIRNLSRREVLRHCVIVKDEGK